MASSLRVNLLKYDIILYNQISLLEAVLIVFPIMTVTLEHFPNKTLLFNFSIELVSNVIFTFHLQSIVDLVIEHSTSQLNLYIT